MQAEMDRSIAAHSRQETLYDQPEKTKNKLRITGPFTVEAVPFPTVLSLDEHAAHVPQGPANDSICPQRQPRRQHTGATNC
jgi:adenine-specific DNA-methyltransferase